MPDSPLYSLPDLIRANADAARAEGEAALNQAKAEHERALAEGDLARAAAVWSALAIMEHEFAGLEAECRQARVYADDLSRNAHAASMLLYGGPIAAFSHAADAYRFFAKQAVLEDGSGPLFYNLSAGQITGDQFFPNESPASVVTSTPAAANPLTLVDWALGRHYLPRQGTPAYAAFVVVFRVIAAVCRANIQSANARAAEDRAGVFDSWKPGALLSGPTPEKKEAQGANDALPA